MDLDGELVQWWLRLINFAFDIIYSTGSVHKTADAYLLQMTNETYQTTMDDDIPALCSFSPS